MHAGVWALAWCAWKRRIHINLHGKQGNKVACNIDLEDINFFLGTCNMGLWPCIQKWSPIKFSIYHFSDKIIEISLVSTNGITPAWVNHNRCIVKKCILMFHAMHEHLASISTLTKTELVMMVCLPSCNIGRPIYIWRIGKELWQFCKKVPTHLSTFANKAFPHSSFSLTR